MNTRLLCCTTLILLASCARAPEPMVTIDRFVEPHRHASAHIPQKSAHPKVLATFGYGNDPKVVKARTRVLEAARDRGIAPGMHIVHPDAKLFQQAVDEGFVFLAYGGDILYLGESCRKAMADIGRG